jgi:hypothetical protein
VEGRPAALTGVLLIPRNTPNTRRFYRDDFPRLNPPPDYRPLYRNRDWAVFTAPGCPT